MITLGSRSLLSKISGKDLDEFIRCPYRMVKCKELGIEPLEVVTSKFIKEELVPKGLRYEEETFSKFEWGITKLPLDKIVKRECVIRQPFIKIAAKRVSKDLGIRKTLIGVPDLLWCKKIRGKLVPMPVEIKSHKDMSFMDKVRATYYSYIIKKRFNMKEMPPAFVWLKGKRLDEGAVDPLEFFDKLIEILEKIAYEETKPRLCTYCKECDFYPDCLKTMERDMGLTLVYKIGPASEEVLQSIGVTNIIDLLNVGEDELGKRLKLKFRDGEMPALVHKIIKKHNLKRLMLQAKAIAERRLLLVNHSIIPKKEVEIFLDTEYDPVEEYVFLIGLAIKKGDNISFHQFFAGSQRQEKRILLQFLNELSGVEDFVLYTWSGVGADIPQLRKSLKKHDFIIDRFETAVRKNHFDLFWFTERNVALPLYSLRIKEVAPFFGFTHNVENMTGADILYEYHQYIENKDELTKSLILKYNQNDIEALIFVKGALEEMMNNYRIMDHQQLKAFAGTGDYV